MSDYAATVAVKSRDHPMIRKVLPSAWTYQVHDYKRIFAFVLLSGIFLWLIRADSRGSRRGVVKPRFVYYATFPVIPDSLARKGYSFELHWLCFYVRNISQNVLRFCV